MSRIAAALIILSLAACGMKGPLELPPRGDRPAPGSDVNTAQPAPTR